MATRIASELGARDLSNIDMAAYYAESAAWEVAALQNLGRNDEGQRVAIDAMAIGDKVLERRPGYRLALHAEQVIEGGLTSVAQNNLNPAEALRSAEHDEQISTTLLNLDPNSTVSANNLGNAVQTIGDALWASGRLHESMLHYAQAIDYFDRAAAAGTGQIILNAWVRGAVAHQQSVLGDYAAAAATLGRGAPFLEKLRQTEAAGSLPVVLVSAIGQSTAADIGLERGDTETSRRLAQEVLTQMRALKPTRGVQEVQKYVTIFWTADVAGQAAYRLGDYAAAEQAEREAVEARKKFLTEAINDRRDMSIKSTWLAMALARRGRLDEAQKVIAPMVQFQRELAAKNHGDRWQPLELAGALYAEALADPSKRPALLSEAAALTANLSPEMRPLGDVRRWRERILKAQQGSE
jgi:tetratricopeptide (TPR) repeat protein